MTQVSLLSSAHGAHKRDAVDRRIGRLLMDHGKLRPEQIETVLQHQAGANQPFGEAAITLKLLARDDLNAALAQQFDYGYLHDNAAGYSAELYAALQPFGPQAEALRAMRSQLRQRWFSAQRKPLAIISPAPRDGRSNFAANLAISFAQAGMRTLLIDADLRTPRQHTLFQLTGSRGLSDALANRGDLHAGYKIPAFHDLSVLPAGTIPPNPSELLGRPSFGVLLNRMRQEFEVIIVDTPAVKSSADAIDVAAQCGGVALLARKHMTRLADLQSLGQRIVDVDATLVGTLLADF